MEVRGMLDREETRAKKEDRVEVRITDAGMGL